MKHKLLALTLALLAAGSLFAQNRVVGTVSDDSGNGVVGVSVMEKAPGTVPSQTWMETTRFRFGPELRSYSLPSAMQRRRWSWVTSPESTSC